MVRKWNNMERRQKSSVVLRATLAVNIEDNSLGIWRDAVKSLRHAQFVKR
jgi:hypothetical protein